MSKLVSIENIFLPFLNSKANSNDPNLPLHSFVNCPDLRASPSLFIPKRLGVWHAAGIQKNLGWTEQSRQRNFKLLSREWWSQAQDKGMLSFPTGPQHHLYYHYHARGRDFWVTGSPSRQHCFRLCSHLLPLALKQYLGLLPKSEPQATLDVYGSEWVLREDWGCSECKHRPKGREEAKALKHSLPPPPPFCPRHQNKRADTRVPMTLVYYQDCTVHALLGYVVQLVPPTCSLGEKHSQTQTTNPQSISGAMFGWGSRESRQQSNPKRSPWWLTPRLPQ